MTSTSQSPLVASAVVGALIVALSTGALRLHDTGVPSQPFWQLQGASPSSAGETDAIVQFRAAAREEQASAIVVAAR